MFAKADYSLYTDKIYISASGFTYQDHKSLKSFAYRSRMRL